MIYVRRDVVFIKIDLPDNIPASELAAESQRMIRETGAKGILSEFDIRIPRDSVHDGVRSFFAFFSPTDADKIQTWLQENGGAKKMED